MCKFISLYSASHLNDILNHNLYDEKTILTVFYVFLFFGICIDRRMVFVVVVVVV